MINTNKELVNFLEKRGELNDLLLKQALLKIDRKFFVPPNLQNEAYGNYPLPIGEGQTISQPSTVVFMLEKLQVKPSHRVLEVGSGCGWVSALLAFMVGNRGKVIGMDIVPELVNLALHNLQNVIATPSSVEGEAISRGLAFTNLKLVVGDGSKGFEPESPYDRIIVSAGARQIPPALLQQLKDQGRLVIPVGNITQDIVVVERQGDKYLQEIYPGFVFVPLVSK